MSGGKNSCLHRERDREHSVVVEIKALQNKMTVNKNMLKNEN